MKNKRKKRVKKHGVPKALKAKAIQLLQDRRFLFLASKKVSELGLVGEQRVVLLLLLAAIALDPHCRPDFMWQINSHKVHPSTLSTRSDR